jgi:lysophospholipid acyltransferase (LPLAT)-like uncharacterized protein
LRRRPGLWRELRHRLRPLVSRPLARLAVRLAPRLYVLYMRLVFATSRVDEGSFAALRTILAEHGGAVALFWHEETLCCVYAFAHLGIPGHGLVALGDAGDVMAGMLERCGHTVSRGGSSRRASRKRPAVLSELARELQRRPETVFGFAVDGTSGPAYHMKSGGLALASACARPVVLIRIWPSRCLRLPTWDRLAVPLPLGVIRHSLRGPYFVPRDGTGRFEPLHRSLERELAELALHSYEEAGQPVPAGLVHKAGGVPR